MTGHYHHHFTHYIVVTLFFYILMNNHVFMYLYSFLNTNLSICNTHPSMLISFILWNDSLYLFLSFYTNTSSSVWNFPIIAISTFSWLDCSFIYSFIGLDYWRKRYVHFKRWLKFLFVHQIIPFEIFNRFL